MLDLADWEVVVALAGVVLVLASGATHAQVFLYSELEGFYPMWILYVDRIFLRACAYINAKKRLNP